MERKTPLKRGKGLKRSGFKKKAGKPLQAKKKLTAKKRLQPKKPKKQWRPKDGGKAWSALSKARREHDDHLCQATGENGLPCLLPANQAAHVHEIGLLGTRHNLDLKCPVCHTLINHIDNLRSACSSRCNDQLARKCPGVGGRK